MTGGKWGGGRGWPTSAHNKGCGAIFSSCFSSLSSGIKFHRRKTTSKIGAPSLFLSPMKNIAQRQQSTSKSQSEQRQQRREDEGEKQQKQPIRRQISQTKVPETAKRETETLRRRAAPSADVRSARRLVQLDKCPLLNKTFTALNTSAAASTDFRSRCSDGTLRSPTPIFRRPRHRSNSIDSDLSDFGPDVVFGILSGRNRTKSRERGKWNFSWRVPKSKNDGNDCPNNNCSNSNKNKFSCGAASSLDMTSTKLPQLDGFCPGRTSCQLQHVSRSHFELIKYKRTLNS